MLIGRDRPVWDDPVLVLAGYSFPSGHATGIASAAGVAIVLTGMLVRRRAVRRLATVLALVVAAGRRRRPDLPGRAQRLRRGGRLPARRGDRDDLAGLLRPHAPLDRAGQRAAHRRGAEPAQEARGGAQPGQGRRARPVPRAGRDAGPRRRLRLGGVVGDHHRGHRARDGARGRRQRGRPGHGDRWRRHHPRGVRGARRHRDRRWASSPPAPATCSRATSTSRSTCARPSTSPSTARTAPSTWSRSAATRWRTRPSS